MNLFIQKSSVSLQTLKSFFHNENMTGFPYISSNHPSVLGYTHATLLRLAKVPLLLLRSCNLSILDVRRVLVWSHCLLSKKAKRQKSKHLCFTDWNHKKQKSHNRSYNTFTIHGAVTKNEVVGSRLTRRKSKNFCLLLTGHLSSTLVTRNYLAGVKVSLCVLP